MTESQAWGILAYLISLYRVTLDEAESAIWLSEIGKLEDPAVAYEAVQQIARTRDRFPTVREIREVYFGIAGRTADERARTHGLAEAPREEIPTWVHVWWWASRDRTPPEPRAFPQAVDERGEPIDPAAQRLTSDEYAALETEWREAGEPKLGGVSALLGHAVR